MSENPRGILYFRDELVGFLVNLDREDRKGDRSFHLEAWVGDGNHTTDRIGRGTIDTSNLCESVFGGIQPSKLISYLSAAVKNIENDGLIQRFQVLVYPDEPQDWQLIDQYPDHEAKNRAFAVFERLAEMDFCANGATLEEGEKAPHFHFAPDAQGFFYDWLTAHERKLRRNGEEPIMIEHLAKFRSLMPSLALIFHLIEVADGTASGPVTLRSTQLAAQWCEYLETHARRIYGLVNDIGLAAAFRLASKIKEGAIQDGFTARDVYRKHWGLLDDKELVAFALDELELLGWVRAEPSLRPPVLDALRYLFTASIRRSNYPTETASQKNFKRGDRAVTKAFWHFWHLVGSAFKLFSSRYEEAKKTEIRSDRPKISWQQCTKELVLLLFEALFRSFVSKAQRGELLPAFGFERGTLAIVRNKCVKTRVFLDYLPGGFTE